MFKKKIFMFAIPFILGVFLLLSLYVIGGNFAVKAEELIIEDKCNCEVESEMFLVDVKGAVKNPGVYKLKSDSIVNDAINAAGGLNKNATTLDINLSKKIVNEMVIYISTKSEYNDRKKVSDIDITKKSNEYTLNPKVDDNQNKCISNKININNATVEELTNLSGVGENKAIKIIEYRNTNGLFKTIDDIKNVSGIGEAAFEKIKDFITV